MARNFAFLFQICEAFAKNKTEFHNAILYLNGHNNALKIRRRQAEVKLLLELLPAAVVVRFPAVAALSVT